MRDTRPFLVRLTRDPALTIANTMPALVAAWVLSWLGFAAMFWWAESSSAESLVFTDSLYWAVTTMTTTGYGDISPATGEGKLVAGVLQVWSIFLTSAVVASILGRLIQDRDAFTHEEQEQFRANLERLTGDLDAIREHMGAPDKPAAPLLPPPPTEDAPGR